MVKKNKKKQRVNERLIYVADLRRTKENTSIRKGYMSLWAITWASLQYPRRISLMVGWKLLAEKMLRKMTFKRIAVLIQVFSDFDLMVRLDGAPADLTPNLNRTPARNSSGFAHRKHLNKCTVASTILCSMRNAGLQSAEV